MSKRSEADGVMFAKRIKALQDYIDWLIDALRMTAPLRREHKWRWSDEFIRRGEEIEAAIAESRKITA